MWGTHRPDGRNGGPDEDRRGLSDVLAVVALFGLVFFGAALVLVGGTSLVDGVQSQSEHEVAHEMAAQTHHEVAQALASGTTRELPSGPLAYRVEDSGSLSVGMSGGPEGTCADDVRVANLGAIVYESGAGEVIYEGGAVWERTDGGPSIVQRPPISHDGDTTRVSVRTVSAAPDGFADAIVRPDEHHQAEIDAATEEMLLGCPQAGHTDLTVTVESDYAELWEEHFEEQAAGNENVSVEGIDVGDPDTVVATFENATEATTQQGLRFDDVEADSVVSKNDDLGVEFAVANDGAVDEDVTVEIDVDGGPTRSWSDDVPSGGDRAGTIDVDVGGASLATDQLHSYEIRLVNDDGEEISSSEGTFYYVGRGGGSSKIRIADHDHYFADGTQETLFIETDVVNTHPSGNAAFTDVVLSLEIDDVDAPIEGGLDMEPVETDEISIEAESIQRVTFDFDVSELPAGEYSYEVEGESANPQGGGGPHTFGPETGTFTITERSGTATVGDFLVEDVTTDPGDGHVADGEAFGIELDLENAGADDATGELTLDAHEGGETSETVALAGDESGSVGADLVPSLEPDAFYEYTATFESDGESVEFPGSFYLAEESGPSPVVNETGSEYDEDEGQLDVTADLGNVGTENVTEDEVVLAINDQNDDELVSAAADVPELAPGWSYPVTFSFDVENVAGTYGYEVEYGDALAEDEFDLGAIDEGDDGVEITAAGEGTVTVLGTEVSAETDCGAGIGNFCFDPLDHHRKSWAPISVSTTVDRTTGTDEHVFENDAADPAHVHNATNLNTFDTQFETYEHTFEVDQGDDAVVSVASTLWAGNPDWNEWDHEHTRVGSGPGYDEEREYRDYHPPDDAWDGSEVDIDVQSGENPDGVQILTDGDKLPVVERGHDDQRSAAEVLNQGAAHRIDEDTGELDLGQNEAVFLFELTQDDPSPGHDDLWEEALANADDRGDPNFNDVIVLLEFDAYNPDAEIVFDTGSGESIEIGVELPENEGEGSVTDPTIDGGATDSEVGSPGVETPDDPGVPTQTEPDDVEVDVGSVQIG